MQSSSTSSSDPWKMHAPAAVAARRFEARCAVTDANASRRRLAVEDRKGENGSRSRLSHGCPLYSDALIQMLFRMSSRHAPFFDVFWQKVGTGNQPFHGSYMTSQHLTAVFDRLGRPKCTGLPEKTATQQHMRNNMTAQTLRI